MKIVCQLDKLETERLPYRLIAETTQRSVWGTGRRKRMFEAEFSKDEQIICAAIIRKSIIWSRVTGTARNGYDVSLREIGTWYKLANFCSQF